MNNNKKYINFDDEAALSFGLPENYFEQSAASILNKVEWVNEHAEYERLSKLQRKNCFEVPVNYFSKVESNAELIDYPKLNSIKKNNSFQAPNNYFVKNAITLQNSASKTVTLFTSKIYYMIAALLVVTIGIWLYGIYANSYTTKDCGTLACLDKNELIKVTSLENVDNEQLYDLVDPKKLEENLDHKLNYKKDVDSNAKGISDQSILDEI